MSSLLSAISGQFGKSVLLGTFFPVVIFIFLSYVFVVPLSPAGLGVVHDFETIDKEWKVLAATLVSVVLTGFLYNLNTPLIRLYEGYPWKDSILGRHFTDRQKDRFRWAKVSLERLEWIGGARDRSIELQKAINQIARILQTSYPDREELILPTRLGNAIRSFEVYPRVQYGMSAIELFPRLIAKIEPAYAQAIDEPKTGLDFMLNSSALSATLAFLILLLALAGHRYNALPDFVLGGGSIVLFGMTSYALYRAALGKAEDWGQQVKGAFDMYRLELLKQLGFAYSPIDLEEERLLWQAINLQLVFPSWGLSAPPFMESVTRVVATSAKDISIVRGLGHPGSDGSKQVTLVVRNNEPGPTGPVRVIDPIPSSMDYLWGSAYLNGRACMPSKTSPLQFSLEDIAASSTLNLSYQLIPSGTKAS
jgi:hypothetical protein